MSHFFQSDARDSADVLWREAGLAQHKGKGHGKTARMRGPDQFFGVGALLVFEARAEGVWRIGQNPAVRGD